MKDLTMSITLSPSLERHIQEKIKSGAYHSSDEVLKESLRLLDQRDEKREQLRRDIQVGIDQAEQGDVAPLDMESLIGDLRAKHAAENPTV